MPETRRSPVRGRVAMNFIMVDVTDIPGISLEAGSPDELRATAGRGNMKRFPLQG